MKDRQIFAYTGPGANVPDYLSISRRDDKIVVAVRSNRGAGLAEIVLPQEDLDRLIYSLRGARINPLIGS